MSITRTLSYYRTDALEALLKAYLEGAEADLLRRGRILLGKIPSNPPREFQLLNQRCRDRLTSLLNELQSLASYDTEIRLRRFKRVVAAVDILEQNAIAALNRATDDDKFLNHGHAATVDVLREIAPSLPEARRGFWDGTGRALAVRPRGGVRGASATGDTAVTVDDLEAAIFWWETE